MTPVAELEQTETESPKTERQAWQVRAGRSAIPPIAAPSLFADVLLEVDSTEKRRRKWAAISTILLESLLLGAVLIVPLMFTEALPTASQFVTFLVAPPPPPPPPPAAAAAAPVRVIRQVETDISDGRLRAPSRIPQKIAMIKEDEAPPAMFSVGGVIGGVPGGELGGVIGGIISSVPHIASVPKLAAPSKRMRISQGVSEGQKIYSPDPIYPRIARDARVQGVVILRAIISKTGEVENLEAVSGPPMLVPAAIGAVKQWRYRPFLLNGEAVEVETGVTVTFHLVS